MYTNHFGLHSEPFSLTPDPAFLYLSPGHGEALAALRVGLLGRRGVMTMVGEVGTGKTTLLYALLADLEPTIRTAYVWNTLRPFEDLLREALADFGVPEAETAPIGNLFQFLRGCAQDGTTAAIVIDEAQNLNDDAFEMLRLLSNFETHETKLLNVILVGQPELDAKLRRPHLRQIAERVAVHAHVNPLDARESRRYLAHRIRRAGGDARIFTAPARRLLVRKAAGIPRRINIVAHNALLFAYARGATRVSRAILGAAVREREGRGLVVHRRRRAARSVATAGAALAVAGTLAWEARERALRSEPAPPSAAAAMRDGRVVPPEAAPPVAAPPAPAARPPETREARAPSAGPARPAGPAAGPAVTAALPTDEPGARPPPPRGGDGEAAPAPEVAIRIPPGATLSALAHELYGAHDPALLERIRRANPQIEDVGRIIAGDTLRFPAAPVGERKHKP